MLSTLLNRCTESFSKISMNTSLFFLVRKNNLITGVAPKGTFEMILKECLQLKVRQVFN